jgi:hypothetical protein
MMHQILTKIGDHLLLAFTESCLSLPILPSPAILGYGIGGGIPAKLAKVVSASGDISYFSVFGEACSTG